MLKLVSFHIQAHLNVFLQILEYFSQSVDVDGLNLLAYSIFELFDCVGVYFCTLCPAIGPKERSRQALDRLPLVSNFLTNFWMQHFDGARLSQNSVWNAIWHVLNEPVCQYLRTRNSCCSTVYIDNSLEPLARLTLYNTAGKCIYTHTNILTYSMTHSPNLNHKVRSACFLNFI